MWFWSILAVYGLGLLIFEGRARGTSREHRALDYALAGRKLTLGPFLATLVATSYGWVLGVGELYAEYGLSAWLFLSLPYSLMSLLFAFTLARRVRRMELTTLTDLLERHYGRAVANLGSLLFLVLCSPAMYLLMGAQVTAYSAGIRVETALMVVTLFSVAYLFRSGFQAVVRTDTLQCIWMYAGFGLLLGGAYAAQGSTALQKLDPAMLRWEMTYSPGYLLSWLLLAAYTFVDPNFYHRLYALQSEATARQGLVGAVVLWTVFDILAAGAAMYGVALNLAGDQPEWIYLRLAQTQLPPPLAALVVVGILAAILSTVDSFVFYSGLALGRDLLQRNGVATGWSMPAVVRLGVVVAAAAGGLWAYAYRHQTAVDLFLEWHPLAVSALLLPVLGGYAPALRLPPRITLIQMLLSSAAAGAYQVGEKAIQNRFPGFEDVNSVVIGLTVSLVIWGLGRALESTSGSRRAD